MEKGRETPMEEKPKEKKPTKEEQSTPSRGGIKLEDFLKKHNFQKIDPPPGIRVRIYPAPKTKE